VGDTLAVPVEHDDRTLADGSGVALDQQYVARVDGR